jgi:hypothetical protein
VGLVVDGAGLLLAGGSAVVDDGVGVAVVVAFGAALAVLACVVLGFTVVLEVLAGVGLELVDDLAVAVVVLGLADVDAVEDADELVVAVVVRTEGEGSVLTVGDFEVVAVEVDVLEVLVVGSLVDGCGLGELLGVAVGVGVAVGEEVDCGTGWHCCTAAGDVVTSAASSAG